MKRPLWLGLFGLLIAGSFLGCSTQKSSSIDNSNEIDGSNDASTPRSRAPVSSQEDPNPEGEIDLELGSDGGDDEEVVIENSAPSAKRRFGASSVDKESTCQAVSDCDGMTTLKCPGERFCEANKCVYRCYESEEVILDDSDEEDVEEDSEEEDE